MSLYIVATPIGNPDDITVRAVDTLRKVDFVICEEIKEGSRLLKRLGIEQKLLTLNEHNEADQTPEIIKLLNEGNNAALISDCGTPVFADPGNRLVRSCLDSKIKIIPVPGASSLLSALVVAGVNLDKFYYAGFLSRNSEQRKKEIEQIKIFKCPVIIYDTPYRLTALITDLYTTLEPERRIVVALNLTQEDETVLRNTISEIHKLVTQKKIKKEFVLIVEPLLRIKK